MSGVRSSCDTSETNRRCTPRQLLELADLPLQAGRHLVERRRRAARGRPRRAPSSAPRAGPAASRSAMRAACRTGVTTCRVTSQAIAAEQQDERDAADEQRAPDQRRASAPPGRAGRGSTARTGRWTARGRPARRPAMPGTVAAVEGRGVDLAAAPGGPRRPPGAGPSGSTLGAKPGLLRSTTAARASSARARRTTYRVGWSAGPASGLDGVLDLAVEVAAARGRQAEVAGSRPSRSPLGLRDDGLRREDTMPSRIRDSSDWPTKSTTRMPSTHGRRHDPQLHGPPPAPERRRRRRGAAGARRAPRHHPVRRRPGPVGQGRHRRLRGVTRRARPCSRRRGRSPRSRGARGRARPWTAGAARGR